VRNDLVVRLNLPKAARYRCHLTDDWRIYTESPLETTSDGASELTLVPSSFAFIEVE
jgi:hypothetical protein